MLESDFLDTIEVQEIRKYLEKKKVSLFFKRMFDLIFSILLLLFLLPIFVLLAIGIKLEDGGSVFYRQDRVTKNGRLFKIFKFRTMVVNADKIGTLVTVQKDNRITKIGSRIRNKLKKL